MSKTKGHCNVCGGAKNHEILHSETTNWRDDENEMYGSDTFETLKCGGCDNVKLRHIWSFSENQEDEITYFPPAIFRRTPEWVDDLWRTLNKEDRFVPRLLKEIYVALQNDLPSLAVMGVRALLETVMISRAGDHGSFAKNIAEFERRGYVSPLQKERLDAILEAGHAAIHRAYEATTKDVITALDITEHLVETVYLHDAQVRALKDRVPVRPPRPAKKHT